MFSLKKKTILGGMAGTIKRELNMFSKTRRLLDFGNAYLDYCQISNPTELYEQCCRLDFVPRPVIVGTDLIPILQRRCQRDVLAFSDTAPSFRLSAQSTAEQVAAPLPLFLKELLQAINKHFDEDFNLLLLNSYKNENDAIGPHADDPYGNGKHGVVTISLGATRIYQIISKQTRMEVSNYSMKNGDVLIMSNQLQELMLHAVPNLNTPCGHRISITTRTIIPNRIPRPVKKRLVGNCLSCKNPTFTISQVCDKCYDLKTFLCPSCKINKTGAPWPCDSCYETMKLTKNKQAN